MTSMLAVNWKSKGFLLFVLFLQLVFCATVFFNIPIARQVIGFPCLTFIPGFILVKLLMLDELDCVETVLFSVGFSVAFLMLTGLLVSEFFFLFGVAQPLSVMPLMTVLSSLVLMGGILLYLKSEGMTTWESGSVGKIPFMLFFLCLFPILTVAGTMYMNACECNMLLLFMETAISLLFAVSVLSRKLLPSKLHPYIVPIVAVAILLQSSLTSNYIVTFGSDVAVEYFVFKATEDNAYWDPTNPYFGGLRLGRMNDMLSVTILPAIYSSLLDMDSTWTFKIVFPLLFSLVPLALYKIWDKYAGKKYAFTSAFLLMAQETFFTEMLGLNRQMIGELFFVLLLLIILNKKQSGQKMCFLIFSFGLVASHYGLSEVFLFFISVALISLFFVKKTSTNITMNMVVLFFVLMFGWYIFTSRSVVFESSIQFGDHVLRQFNGFFDPASRGQTVLRGLGLERPPTIWNTLSRAFAYATQFLIVVGFIGLITKQVRVPSEKVYFTFVFVAMAFLAALLLVPGLANTMNMTRFYHILLFFLAPLCVMGAEILVKPLSRRKEEFLVSILLVIVLVPYFLFQTSFVYEIVGGDSWSISLSKYRIEPFRLYRRLGYTDACSVFGAQWLSQNVNVTQTQVYADYVSLSPTLLVYGLTYKGYVYEFSNITKVAANGVIYLNALNVVHGMIVSGSSVWNSSDFSIFDSINKIYSNGGSEIYRNSFDRTLGL